MGDDSRVACALGHVDGLYCLGDCANLIEFDENRVAGTHFDAFGEALGICDEEVVANNLDFIAQCFGEFDIAFPVVLIETIFDGYYGVFIDPVCVKLNHLIRGEESIGTGFPKAVAFAVTFLEEFARSRIEGDGYLLTRLIASFFNSTNDVIKSVFIADVWSKSTLITNSSVMTIGFQYGF